ncbi:MAG: DsbA family protein [Candidatus Moranbacteria bacterium]|nr:DsbA family protein [Candidatus Moranbacteria bacterium]
MKEEKIKEASVEEVNSEDVKEENVSVQNESQDKQKIKNLISLAILLGGLFLGSLFVDLSQLVSGGGISKRVVQNMDIFRLDEKTWVAYSDPIVNVQIITDDTCESCGADEISLQLKQIVPTMLVSKIDSKTKEGQAMIKKFDIKAIPAFIFSSEIEETDFFAQASPVLVEKDGKYVLNTIAAGIPAGKYVELPSVGENDISYGSKDAKVTLVEYSDFQCPYCKAFHGTISQVVEKYGDQIQFVFKQLPLESIHPNAMNAALASECAAEQGKFIEYADKLFANQKDWGSSEGVQKLKSYAAQIGLKTADFNACLDEEKYADKIAADMAEADKFGVTGTPALFINDQFKGGVSSLETITDIIDEQLGEGDDSDNDEDIDAMLEEIEE